MLVVVATRVAVRVEVKENRPVGLPNTEATQISLDISTRTHGCMKLQSTVMSENSSDEYLQKKI